MTSARAESLEWLRRHCILSNGDDDRHALDLLARAAGDAELVALGEADHFIAEPLELRNRLFRYLVEERGFSAIAIESGIAESRAVNEYVRTGAGDLDAVLREGITWTFDDLPQNRELILWMAEVNRTRSEAGKLRFYGFDVPGSPGNPNARPPMGLAAAATLRFLERVGDEAAELLCARLASFGRFLHFDLFGDPRRPGYFDLTMGERNQLTEALRAAAHNIEAAKGRYTAAPSGEDYDWALRTAIGAVQLDDWLREIPLAWRASSGQLRFLDVASDLRDRAQAENLRWIVERERPRGRVFAFAHNGHLSAWPVKWLWRAPSSAADVAPEATYLHTVAGTYLRQWLGDRYFVIGNLINSGTIGNTRFEQELIEPVPDALDGLAHDVGGERFVVGLRGMSPEATEWLEQQRPFSGRFSLPLKYEVTMEVRGARAFDALVYMDRVSPAQRMEQESMTSQPPGD